MRTFIAVQLPATVQDLLLQVQETLRKELAESGNRVRISWVDPEKIHLTLRFLGETAPDQVDDLCSRLRNALAASDSFQLTVTELGCFPGFRRPSVVWVGVGGELDRLLGLQRRVEEQVCAIGFAADQRPFSPHLTLGRISRQASQSELRRLGQLFRERVAAVAHRVAKSQPPAVFRVRQIVHMRSNLQPSGAQYTALYRIPLIET